MNKLRLDIERFHQLSGNTELITPFILLRSCFNPRIAPVVVIRLSEYFYQKKLGFIAKLFSLINVIFFGLESSPRVQIAGGLFLPHTVGTVIGAERIGKNVTIMQGVTLGAKEPDMYFTTGTRPVIGNHVLIGAGAKIIGNITVGDYAKIGANAVVLQDVPANSLAVGVPAKIVSQKQVND
ncbi:serine O-acetyltransferase EpsC [Methylomonas sp. AM2-LC]|uniref:serine O-acetyltransferase EpsC n=1 Tax=Methylomonas sp. AM2-LC TaxID=3153301 RepID=UPI0032643699